MLKGLWPPFLTAFLPTSEAAVTTPDPDPFLLYYSAKVTWLSFSYLEEAFVAAEVVPFEMIELFWLVVATLAPRLLIIVCLVPSENLNSIFWRFLSKTPAYRTLSYVNGNLKLSFSSFCFSRSILFWLLIPLPAMSLFARLGALKPLESLWESFLTKVVKIWGCSPWWSKTA